MKNPVGLIIAAAGSGTRMQSATRKPFLDLNGQTILHRTLERFVGTGGIVQVILTVNAEDYARKDELLMEKLPLMLTDIVPGGKTRTESIANALAVLDGEVEIVLVHDAVRPFVRSEVIRGVRDAAVEYGAAIAAAPVKDTIKRASGAVVTETVRREGLYVAQTPQGFRREVILKAYQKRGAAEYTDDAEVVEKTGAKVVIVESGHDNFKITTPEDLVMALAIVGSQR